MSAPQYGMPPRQPQPSQPYYANAYGPPQGYSAQQQQAYPPQAQPSQDPRFAYSSPPPPESQQKPQPNNYPYPMPSQGPAPFHFLPNGTAPPPPHQQQTTPKPVAPQQSSDHYQQGGAPYSPQLSHQQLPASQQPQPQQQQQQQQFPPAGANRPNSIHTLNSGNPQELGTGSYEAPVDARHQQDSQYPPPQSQYSLPLRQGTHTSDYDSPTSTYSPQPQGHLTGQSQTSHEQPPASSSYAPYTTQQPQPLQPSHAPPGVPIAAQHSGGQQGFQMPPAGTYPSLGGGGGGQGSQGQQSYQAYSNPQAHDASAPRDADDASDFYR